MFVQREFEEVAFLTETGAPDVYRVNSPLKSPSAVARLVKEHLDENWACPMKTYGATRYVVTLRPGRHSRELYARIGLS